MPKKKVIKKVEEPIEGIMPFGQSEFGDCIHQNQLEANGHTVCATCGKQF
jgi:hypothetical protein